MDFVTLMLYVHASPGGMLLDECEDERVAAIHPNGKTILISVQDGCGGAGGKQYLSAEGWTGARIAAHETGRILWKWFRSVDWEKSREIDDYREELLSELRQRLIEDYQLLTNDEKNPEGRARVRFSTRMSTPLPTTLAAITATIRREERIHIRSFWAGNSRNYILLQQGLKQISQDDLVGNLDPFDDLTKDGLLSNCVKAGQDFQIHAAECEVGPPCITLCASDGVFSYFDMPMRLEWLLLNTLQSAGSPEEWEEDLRKTFAKISGDDHTLQLAAIRFRDFEEIKTFYHKRWENMRKLYSMSADGHSENREKLLLSQWEEYKKDYLAVPTRSEE